MFNSIITILLCILLCFLPILKTIGDVYYSFVVYLFIFLFILIILLIKIDIKLKIILISILCYVYKRNLILTTKTFRAIIKEGYINNVDHREDNSKLRDIVYDMFKNQLNLKLDFSKLPDKPSIIVCNYCTDRLENLPCILIPKDICILMRDTPLHKVLKWPIYIYEKNSYDNTKKEIIEHVNKGRSIFSYVTKPPKLGTKYIQGLRSGMFRLAKELGIPITLMAIDYIDTNIGIIPYQNFNILIGDTFIVDDVKISMYKARKFFSRSMRKFINTKYIM